MLLTVSWEPLGPETSLIVSTLWVAMLLGGLLWFVQLFQKAYPWLLRLSLDHKRIFLCIPLTVIAVGMLAWQGFDWMPNLALGGY